MVRMIVYCSTAGSCVKPSYFKIILRAQLDLGSLVQIGGFSVLLFICIFIFFQMIFSLLTQRQQQKVVELDVQKVDNVTRKGRRIKSPFKRLQASAAGIVFFTH